MTRIVMTSAVAVLLMAAGATHADAQAVVYVRTDATGVIYRVNAPNVRQKAKAAAERRDGEWKLLFETEKPGKCSVFVAQAKGGGSPQYFYSCASTKDQAIKEAKAQGKSATGKWPDSAAYFAVGGMYKLDVKNESNNTTFGVRG